MPSYFIDQHYFQNVGGGRNKIQMLGKTEIHIILKCLWDKTKKVYQQPETNNCQDPIQVEI